MTDGGALTRRPQLTRAPSKPPESVYEFLTFGLGDDRFAVPLASVKEILKTSRFTTVPRSEDAVLGVVSVRGQITTVFDLRMLLSLPQAPLTNHSRVLLLQGHAEVLGLLVDQVHQVHRLADDEIELASAVSGDLSDYVVGVGRPGVRGGEALGDGDIVILLDPEPLLRR